MHLKYVKKPKIVVELVKTLTEHGSVEHQNLYPKMGQFRLLSLRIGIKIFICNQKDQMKKPSQKHSKSILFIHILSKKNE